MRLGAGVTASAGLLFIGQTTPIGWIACGLILTLGSNLAGYSIHTYRSELFPTNLRARHRPGVSHRSLDRRIIAMTFIALFGPRTRGLASEAIGNKPAH